MKQDRKATQATPETRNPASFGPLSWTNPGDPRGAILKDLQGNILKGHGRGFTANLFLRFKGPETKDWIKALNVTCALQQLQDSKAFQERKVSGPGFIVFFLSAAGYKALGIPEAQWPNDSKFRGGMKASGKDLNDPPSKPSLQDNGWDGHFQEEIHALLLIAHSDEGVLHSLVGAEEANMPESVEVIGREMGRAYKNENGDGIEQFGYVDGRSQPLFLREDIERERIETDGISVWNPAFPLKQVLQPDPDASSPNDGFGSYFVFRKLEQNVKGFKEREGELGEWLVAEAIQRGMLQPDATEEREIVAERAGALMVGRFEDGTPVVLQNKEGMHNPVPNNFTYNDDADGTKCPFHAHIRKTNPRGEANDPNERNHIMARRGITYGLRKLDENGQFAEPEGQEPVGGVGLLFMAYMSDIENQFEHTQKRWANNQDFKSKGVGIDPVIGQGKEGWQHCPLTWGLAKDKTRFERFDFRNFVTLRGGEYFFAPPLSFLKGLK